MNFHPRPHRPSVGVRLRDGGNHAEVSDTTRARRALQLGRHARGRQGREENCQLCLVGKVWAAVVGGQVTSPSRRTAMNRPLSLIVLVTGYGIALPRPLVRLPGSVTPRATLTQLAPPDELVRTMLANQLRMSFSAMALFSSIPCAAAVCAIASSPMPLSRPFASSCSSSGRRCAPACAASTSSSPQDVRTRTSSNSPTSTFSAPSAPLEPQDAAKRRFAHRHADARPNRFALREAERYHSRVPRTSSGKQANPIIRTTEMPITAGFAALTRSRLRNPGYAALNCRGSHDDLGLSGLSRQRTITATGRESEVYLLQTINVCYLLTL